MNNYHENWVKLTGEAALEPEIPICDCHHHLWDYPDSCPESLIRESARPERHYLLENFLKDTAGGHKITRTVFMQCGYMYKNDGPQPLRPIGETEFAENIGSHAANDNCLGTAVADGIVGFADLMLGSEINRVLEAHIAASPTRFRGIRFVTPCDALFQTNSPITYRNLLAETKFKQGFRQLQKYGLSFDAWLYYFQLPDLVELARLFPYTTVILDHIGTPLGLDPFSKKREDVFKEWKKGIAELSACGNVVVKLGGLGMPICGFGWNKRKTPINSIDLAGAMAPYYHWCIEKFGVNRCMFESNFPVDKSSYSYTILWNAFKRITKNYSSAEKAQLFQGTAMRVYRLHGAC